MYNLTNLTDTNQTFVGAMSAANDVTGGWFWLVISIALWLVLTLAMRRNGILPAFVASSFITSVAGMLLVITGLVNGAYLIYYILIMGFGVAGGFVASKGE